jgi:putative FmdB family regulatory protein
MPLYDYECPNCGHSIERRVKHVDSVVICSQCGVDMTRQFPMNGAFILVGDCWARDRYTHKQPLRRQEE